MKVLITNDDGIYSPGLATLARAAQGIGDVYVFAPDVEQSSMGHAITASKPLSYHPTPIGEFEAWRVDGTPADCVALGTTRVSDIDVVMSGINLGSNLGNAMWHSGTLAGAKQASLLGIQGIAFSMPAPDGQPHFDDIEPYLLRVFQRVVGDPDLPLVNVNLPNSPKGLRWTRQSVRHYEGQIVQGQHPLGREIFWFVVKPMEEVDEDTDRFAVQNDYVSITPLRLDLTDHDGLRHVHEAGR